jgi:hypothetical protein
MRIGILIKENFDSWHEKEGSQMTLNPQKQVHSEPCNFTLWGCTSALPHTLKCNAKIQKYSEMMNKNQRKIVQNDDFNTIGAK